MLNLLYLVKNVGKNSHGESNFEVPFDRGFVNVWDISPLVLARNYNNCKWDSLDVLKSVQDSGWDVQSIAGLSLSGDKTFYRH